MSADEAEEEATTIEEKKKKKKKRVQGGTHQLPPADGPRPLFAFVPVGDSRRFLVFSLSLFLLHRGPLREANGTAASPVWRERRERDTQNI